MECKNCEGGQVYAPIGEHFITHCMAMDACAPEMAGMSMGVERGCLQVSPSRNDMFTMIFLCRYCATGGAGWGLEFFQYSGNPVINHFSFIPDIINVEVVNY